MTSTRRRSQLAAIFNISYKSTRLVTLLLVSAQLLTRLELLPAPGALVRGFPRVDALVTAQVVRLAEGELAEATHVRPFAGVRAHVPPQIAGGAQLFAAVLALVRQHTRVDHHVAVVVRFPVELLAAVLALELLLAVKALMRDQQVLGAEVARLRALGAGERLRARVLRLEVPLVFALRAEDLNQIKILFCERRVNTIKKVLTDIILSRENYVRKNLFD